MGWFYVFHEWFYMLFVILRAPVRLKHFNEVTSSNRWDWNARREGLLNKNGPGPLPAICLGKCFSHRSSQGCLRVESWGGGTVHRYGGKWWGRRHQNHAIIHPLQSLKPPCVVAAFGRCNMSEWACCFLVLTPLFPQGCCYGMTYSKWTCSSCLWQSPRPNPFVWQDSRKCIMNWLRTICACIVPGC